MPRDSCVAFVFRTGRIGALCTLVACGADQGLGVAPQSHVPPGAVARAHVINGRVVDPEGRPILGASVEWDTDFSMFDAIRVQVDSAGSYKTDFAPVYSYIEMRARSNDTVWEYTPIVRLRLDTLPDMTRVDFTLHRR